MKQMTYVLMGDETLLVQCGEMLLERGHTLAGVVTGDAAVAGWASGHSLPIIDASADLEREIEGIGFDWFLSIANLRVIPNGVWKRARSGAINFHDGPLPRYAGLNTPAWAILSGETEHGVTWHALSDGIDEGDIYVQSIFEISEHDTSLTLNAKCFEAGIASFAELIAKMEAGPLIGQPQDLSQRTYFAKNARPGGASTIDFHQETSAISRLLRALSFGRGYANPLALPKVKTGRGVYSVLEAETASAEAVFTPPGTVLRVDENGAAIATTDGAIVIKALADCYGQSVSIQEAFHAGDVLPPLGGADAERLTTLSNALARDEDYFRTQLRGSANPEIHGLLPNVDGPPVWEVTQLAAGAVRSGEDAVAAIACFFGRTGNQARYQLGYVGDRLAALAGDWPGYVSPTMPLTFDVTTQTTAAELSQAARTALSGMTRRQGVVGDLLARNPKLAAVKPAVVIRQAADVADVAPVDGSVLTVVVPYDSGEIRLLGDTSRLPRTSLDALARQLTVMLAAIGEGDGQCAVASLPILSDDEIHVLVTQRNQTARDYDRAATVHQLIEAQAKRTPDATALICAGEKLTYGELDARANRVARTLIGLGVRPDGLVGLYVSRSIDLVVGALGIWKAGGAYVPLDPTYPRDRIALMIEDSGLKVAFTDDGVKLPSDNPEIRTLTVAEAARGDAAVDAPASVSSPSNLAYVIYTSGSTGRPKGVMLEHRNVVNFFAGMGDRIPRSETSQPVWLAVTSLSFDISVLELFWTLANGFAVVVHADRRRAASTQPAVRQPRGNGDMDFSLYFWGNDDGVGPRKYQLLLDGARFADDHGFCAVWTPERHFHAFGGPYPNPSVTGAAVAAVTRNMDIRAGSCVLPLHHPARVAEEWAVVDNIANGRTGLAFASGWMPDDFLLRPENAPPHNKANMLRDIEVVRKLWRGEAVPFDAPGGKKVDVVTQPRPVSKELAVWVTTAGNPDTYREAARLGANVLTHLLGQSIEEVAEKITIYRETLKETGRNPDDFTVTLMLHTLVGDDREAVRAAAREPMKAYLRSATALIKQYAWAFPAFKKPAGVAKAMDVDLQTLDAEELDAIIEFAFLRYFDDSGLFGTIEDAKARVEQLKAIGVNEIACLIDFGVSTEDALRALEPLAEVVAATRTSNAADAGEGGLADEISRHAVTHMQCTPSMAAMALMSDEDRAALRHVRHLFIGGEALQPKLLQDLKSATDATIENMYGPTETTIWSATGPATMSSGAVPLGTPIANTQLYVLDQSQQLVAAGMPGELYIAGDGVARGYLNREDLTSERFMPDPFHPGGRMYRTGDLVRIGEDGELHFLGRADFQVKVRGYRIELGEIEARIGLHPAVAEAVVVARAEDANDVRIVAYVRYKGAPVSEADLRAHVRGALPEFMVPSHFVTMQTFPLTPNAKVDRKALPRPEEAAKAVEVAEFVAPADDLQQRLADAFKAILGVEKVGAFDNFFNLGGHSLLAVQLHRELKKTIAPELTITDIYRFPTVSGLASHIQDRGKAGKHLSQVAERAAMRRQAQLGRRGR
ncbi:MupA/Atu3671 family FMN-dependent luciferase-like monooxygenase [Leptospira interrogans]